MFGAWLFWSTLFWSGSTTLSVSSTAAFEYNWYAFGTSTFVLKNIPNFQSATNILYDTYNVALAHWGWANWYYIKPKRLVVEWTLHASSASELEDAVDSLKYAMLQNWKILTYTKPNWVILNATASCTNLDVKRSKYHITYVPVSIEFTILDPFLYDTEVNETSNAGNTSSPFTGTVSVLGCNYEVYPIVYLTYNSATSCTSLSFTMNWSTITVTDTFSAWDIIIIDSKEKDVTINSVSWQDYTGEFPILPLWDTSYSVTSDGTFNLDLIIQWYNTYV